MVKKVPFQLLKVHFVAVSSHIQIPLMHLVLCRDLGPLTSKVLPLCSSKNSFLLHKEIERTYLLFPVNLLEHILGIVPFYGKKEEI